MCAWIHQQDPIGMGPGPTYDVQILWGPGGSTYSSRSILPTNLDKLGKLKSYLDYIQ